VFVLISVLAGPLPGVGDGADVLAVLCEEHGEAFPWEDVRRPHPARRDAPVLRGTGRGGAALHIGRAGMADRNRTRGGYVVGPGSPVSQPDGTGRYEVTYDRPPAPLPPWLAALLTAPRPAAPSLECRPPGDGPVRAPAAYARAALYGESETVRTAAEGGRAFRAEQSGLSIWVSSSPPARSTTPRPKRRCTRRPACTSPPTAR